MENLMLILEKLSNAICGRLFYLWNKIQANRIKESGKLKSTTFNQSQVTLLKCVEVFGARWSRAVGWQRG